MIFTTGHLERETGITERTISYYDSLGLLSIEKCKGKRMVTDLDLIILAKIFILKITNKRIKDIKNTNLACTTIQDLMKDLEYMNDQILNLLICLERFEKEQYQRDDIFNLLNNMNIYIQKYVEKN
jgi:DNA-binding transcriptional MerR regulator